MFDLQTYHSFLIPLIILGQAGIVFLLIGLLFKNAFSEKLRGWIQNNALRMAFVVSIATFLGPLTYSEIIQFEPCRLCWFQRIAMFPQLILLGIAQYYKDKGVVKYALPIAVIGALISIRHYFMQFGVGPEGACDTVGQSISCGSLYVFELGYITIPMMALTGFLAIILLLLYARKAQ